MRVNLSNYEGIPKRHIPAYWYKGIAVYAFVYRDNKWVHKGFYNLKKVPIVWRTGILDLLKEEEVNFMIEKGAS